MTVSVQDVEFQNAPAFAGLGTGAATADVAGPAVVPPPSGFAERSIAGALQHLLASHRHRVAMTHVLCHAENLLWLAQPFVLGWTINDLLHQSYTGLMLYVVLHLGHMLVSSGRLRYSTRVFAEISARLAARLTYDHTAAAETPADMTARLASARESVDFIAQHVPLLIRGVWSLAGPLLALGLYDWTLIPLCLVLIVPAVLLNAAYGCRALQLNRGLHEQAAREPDIVGQGDALDVRRHFDAIGRWRIRIADAEATNFCLMELFVLGLLATTLVSYCTGKATQPGDILAVFRYVLIFVIGLESVPKLVPDLHRLRALHTCGQKSPPGDT